LVATDIMTDYSKIIIFLTDKMIAPRATVLLLLLAFALFAFEVQTVSSSQVGHILMDNYDDGSEMNQKIILEFMSS